MLAVMLAHTGWHFTYVIDDPAIHLAMGDRLAHDGTWGITPGVYQSASSSPLWTVLLSGFSLVLPRPAMNWVPLILNIAAAIWIIELLARHQTLLAPSRRRWFEGVAVGSLAAVVLFLPGLAVVGMEHTLHAALLLQVMVLLGDSGDADWAAQPAMAHRFWLAVGLLFLAGFTRFETAFFGAAVGAGLLITAVPGWSRRPEEGREQWRQQVLRTAAVGVATVSPLAIYGVVNTAFGQSFLPNSVEAKSALAGTVDPSDLTVANTVEHLAVDPLVLVGTVLALTYLVAAWGGRRQRAVFPATVVVVTAALHSTFASYGWYERYQAYVILLVVWFLLQAGAEVLPARARTLAPALIVIAALFLAPVKWQLINDAPVASENTYRQRYAAARFLERNYPDQSIATGELGYIGWFHDGPITDVIGLGDHEVLQARAGDQDTPAYWADLIRRRDVQVIAVYPQTLFLDTPANWILVGTWQLGQRQVTAFGDEFQFWAPTPDDVDRLRAQLLEFEPEMPDGTELEISPLLDFRVEQVRADPSPGTGQDEDALTPGP